MPENLTLDLLQRAMELFSNDPAVRERGAPVVLAEMTLRSLTAGAGTGHEDFLARADIVHALGFDVLIPSGIRSRDTSRPGRTCSRRPRGNTCTIS